MPNSLRQAAPLALLILTLATPLGARDTFTLRVGTSGDYAPFSLRDAAGGFEGFDIAVARAYAQERGLALEFVPFHWPRLLDSLEAGRFDVAMAGITVRPERSAVGRFSVPIAETGTVVLVREPDRWSKLDALDSRAARIAVNEGGHLERIARLRFPRATLLALAENRAVLQALLAEAVDAVVSEQLEAELWLAQAEGAALYGPFTRDRKAYLVRADRAELAADLDAWLLAREADGTLAALRREHLKAASGPVATPLAALLAAIDERLALMPLVGAAKREQGFPLEVPEREQFVIDAAAAQVVAAAERARRTPPPDAPVRRFFRAQIEAAKQVQWAAVRDPEFAPPSQLPDVESVLRPALLRIGERIARLLVVLPAGLDDETLQRATRDGLRTSYLEAARVRAIADAIASLSRAPRD